MTGSPYVYMLVGAMGIIILGHWFPSLKNLSSNGNVNGNITRLDHIQGIDLRALAICRQKGLI